MIALLLFVSTVYATNHLTADHHVVTKGETIASIAKALAPGLAMEPAALEAQIRGTNALPGTAEPPVGTVLNVPSGSRTENPSMVVQVIGSGYAEGGGLAKSELVRGLDLPAGATVCTGPDSYATIRLATAPSTPDAPTFAHDDVSLYPDTCLTVTGNFTGAGGERSSLVTLSQGGVTVRSADETPGIVTVITPTGVTSGDNGGFRVHADATTARTEAIDDAVGVFGFGSQIEMSAGEGTKVEAGKAPDVPIVLLGGVTLIKPLNAAILRRPDFTWDPVERAAGYQVELSTESDFSEIVAQEQVSVNEWHPEALLVPFRVPQLYWRVASFDRSGFLGTPSLPREIKFPLGIGP